MTVGFIVKIEFCHNLVVKMFWDLTIVKLVKYDDIKIVNSKISVHEVILKDFRKEQKYVELLKVLLPLSFTNRLIWLLYHLRLVQAESLIHLILSRGRAIRELMFQSCRNLCCSVVLSCNYTNFWLSLVWPV